VLAIAHPVAAHAGLAGVLLAVYQHDVCVCGHREGSRAGVFARLKSKVGAATMSWWWQSAESVARARLGPALACSVSEVGAGRKHRDGEGQHRCEGQGPDSLSPGWGGLGGAAAAGT